MNEDARFIADRAFPGVPVNSSEGTYFVFDQKYWMADDAEVRAWGADYPDAENFFQLLYGPNRSPASNGAGYDNKTFNALYKRATMMFDSPERTALYEKMNKFVANQVPWIFGVHRQEFVLAQGWFKNFASTDFENGMAKYLNVDIEEKKRLLKLF